MTNKTYLHIFSNIFIVKGATNAILVDIHRRKHIQISNEVADSLDKLNGQPLDDIMNNSASSNNSEIQEILDHLIEQEIVFLSDLDASYFPPIEGQFLSPHTITNFVWELSDYKLNEVEEVFQNNKDIITSHAEFVFFRKLEAQEVVRFAQTVERLCPFLESYAITLQLCEEAKEVLINLLDNYPRLVQLSVYSRAEDRIIESSKYKDKKLILSAALIESFKHCGIVGSHLFNSSTYHFTESLSFNSCLNRKISIDIEGNIKNCPAMQESFGNIKDINLVEVLDEPEFKKYWGINKDKIHVCKDCEFRYICTDCRAFVDDPSEILSKPLKCGYNPYEGKWSEWSENPLKQKTIDFYGLNDVVNTNV